MSSDTLKIIRQQLTYDRIPRLFCELKEMPFGQFVSLQDRYEHGMPDFEISLENEKIGFEITEIFQDETPAREDLLYSILKDARSIYKSKNGLPIFVTVSFIKPLNARPQRRQELAQYIANFLITKCHSLSSAQAYDLSESNLYPEILYLKAEPLESEHIPKWYPSDSTWAQTLSQEIIDGHIQRKQNKLSSYQTRYSKNWLLLATNLFTPSQLFNISPEVLHVAYKCDFDKVFLLSCMEKRLWNLNTMPSIQQF